MIGTRKTDARDFPTLHEPHALIETFLPRMVALLDKPHASGGSDEWSALKTEVIETFTDHEWVGDEGPIVFDLLVAVAEREVTLIPRKEKPCRESK